MFDRADDVATGSLDVLRRFEWNKKNPFKSKKEKQLLQKHGQAADAVTTSTDFVSSVLSPALYTADGIVKSIDAVSIDQDSGGSGDGTPDVSPAHELSNAPDTSTDSGESETPEGFLSDLSGVGSVALSQGMSAGSTLTKATGGFLSGYQGIKHMAQGYSGHKLPGEDSALHGDRILTNLASKELEDSATNFLGVGSGVTKSVMDLTIGSAGPQAIVTNAINTVVSGKKTGEDIYAAERLRKQIGKSKHDLDHFLPSQDRINRFHAFLAEYRRYEDAGTKKEQKEISKEARSAGVAKRGEFKRFEKDLAAYQSWQIKNNERPTDTVVLSGDPSGFLEFCTKNRIREYGSGSSVRDTYTAAVKSKVAQGGTAGLTAEERKFHDARSLNKLAKFGHRRKAESATMNAIDTTASAIGTAGAAASGADYGVMSATSMGIKALKGGYTGTKSLVKRGRRVHKLRTAKNAMEYGGKKSRGVLWGAAQFFKGDIGRQMGHARAALANPNPQAGAEHKQAVAQTMPDQVKLLKKLTIQCERRINELLDCLISADDQIRHRAQSLLRVLANSNLTSMPWRITHSSLERFYDIYLASRNEDRNGPRNPPLDNEEVAKQERAYELRRDAIKKNASSQLKGVGG